MNDRMRHTVFLLVGEELSNIAPLLKQYTLMYGEGDAPNYLQVLSCTCDGEEIAFRAHILDKPEVETEFTSGLENRYRISTALEEALKSDADIKQYFVNLFNRTVTIEDPGSDGTLNICLFLPIYKTALCNSARRIVDIIESTGKQIRIDVLGMTPEVAMLLPASEENKIVPDMLEACRERCKQNGKEIIANDKVHRFLLFEDTNSSGLALDLDLDRLIRVLGEYALIYVEHYHVIYPTNQLADNIDVTTFGLSLMAFDKVYFVHYLLRKAYIYLLKREKVSEVEKVNVNHAADVAQKMLEKHVKLYRRFVDEVVDPKLHELGGHEIPLSETQLLEAKLDKQIEDAIEDLQSFIMDPKLSLPEKQAVMAQLLGEDDALVKGVQYFKEQLILDDCDEETLNFFINEDNRQVSAVAATEDTPAKITRGVLTAPVDEHEKVFLPLNEIKVLRANIRQRTTYIRSKTEELEMIADQVKDAENIQKRLSEDGFKFGDTIYKLLPAQLETRLFKETYKPTATKVRNVDLRENFTEVKNQGELGACSAFAMVSIFEYILKKTNPSNPDLSEMFSYYNALHKRQGTDDVVDEGTSFFEMVQTMSEEGVSSEELCVYDGVLKKPSDKAYEDAKNRLVKEAKNVEISHMALTSALAEGYPIAISLKVFDTFTADQNGFVYRPTAEEIASGNSGNHAMVICGFSEDDKVYIVRNSWGTTFGAKGYCFIPFSYIEDPGLNNQACIITDVQAEEKLTIKGTTEKTVSFNMTDDSIRSAILRILIDEESIDLQRDSQKYAKLRYDYEKLLQVLSNPSKRDEIFEASVRSLDSNIATQKGVYSDFINVKRPESIKEHKSTTMRIIWWTVAIFAVLGLLLYMCYEFDWQKMMSYTGIAIVADVLFASVYWGYRHNRLSILKKELEDEAAQLNLKVAQLKREKQEKHLRMHLAGKVISTLTETKIKLVNRYHGLVTYNHALKKWEEEEEQKLTEMILPNKTPCIPLLENKVLDEYFEAHKAKITEGVNLYELVGNKNMSDNDVLTFKLALRDKLIAKLEEQFEKFSMMDYVLGTVKYAYLAPTENVVSTIVPKMDKRSTVFLNIVQNGIVRTANVVEKHLLLHADRHEDKNVWRELYTRYFSMPPSDNDLDSKYKLIELQIQNLTTDEVDLLK